jgi:hypothetical protein
MALKRVIGIFALAVVMAGCSSSSKHKAEALVREPSPIDESHPPQISVEGLVPEALLTTPATSVALNVQNYPLASKWQYGEWVLNDGAAQRFYSNKENVELSEAAGLKKGFNLLRVYLLRSWGEYLKNPEAFVMVPFFWGEKKGSAQAKRGPVLTLVSPRGSYTVEQAKKLLFDFHVRPWEGDKLQVFKIHYTLNGKKRELESGQPYYFTNMRPGTYNLTVEVVKGRNAYAGEYSKVTSQFVITDQQPLASD